jgi:hypothetical protein
MKKVVSFLFLFLVIGCGYNESQVRVEILNDTVEVNKVVPIFVETTHGAILSKRLTDGIDLAEATKDLVEVYLGQYLKVENENRYKLVGFEVLRTSVKNSNECYGYYPVNFSYNVTPMGDVGKSDWIAGNGHVVEKTNSVNDKFLIGGLYDDRGVWELKIFGTGGGGGLCLDGTHDAVLKGERIEWEK